MRLISVFRKLFLTALVGGIVGAQAAVLTFSNSVTEAAILVTTIPGPVSVSVQEDMFTSLPSTPGFVNAAVKNRISVGVDHSSLNYVGTAYHYRYKLELEVWEDNTISPTYVTDIYLSVKYDPTAATNFRDLSTYSFVDGHKVKVNIKEIYNYNTSSLVTDPPDNMKVVNEIEIERYYDFTSASATCPTHSAIDLNSDSKDDQLVITWGSLTGAEEYDLEWTYVDDYDVNLGTPKSISSIQWNFIGDNTRVRVKNRRYKINLAYDRGYIIYRVRGVGRSTTNHESPVYGPWSLADAGTDPSGSACMSITNYYYLDPHEEDLNWQYTGTFAEEGKKKEVVGYYDGSLRNRQTVTVNNTDSLAIAGESYYDYQGRKAVDALPVPTGFGHLGYNPSFNVNVSLDRYSKLDFDLDGTSSCSSEIGPMSTSTGSSKYYSSSNPQNLGNNAFIPDAEQFPFSQVEYTPDNTGRIRRMGGVGPNHQLNTNHETKYYYGQPTQWELDRLFGSEVGYNNHYKKNMVIDPNGQISISYMDAHGRVVATALSGESPENVSALNGDDPVNVTVDLLAKDANGLSLNNYANAYFNSLTFQTQLLVSSPGEHTFNYSLEMPQMLDSCLAESICFDCIYDLKIEIRDECGALVYQSATQKVGSPALNGSCSTTLVFPSSPSPIVETLGIGNYQVSKILTINEEAYNYYLSLYLSPEGNSCFMSYEAMLEQELSLVNYEDCNFSCERCVEVLGSKDEYVTSGRGSEQDWQEAYDHCVEPCRPVSPCEIMLMAMKSDMSPGGQYAEWFDSTILAVQVKNFPLSVLNEDNKLPDASAYWRNPKLPDGSVGYYEDDNATRSRVTLIQNIDRSYSPPVISDSYVYGNAEEGYYTYPEYLSRVEDFIAKWGSNWANSLVVYHPEYCYNRWCVDKLEGKAEAGALMSYEFDDLLDNTITYADAVSNGYISDTTFVLPTLDPYFLHYNVQYGIDQEYKMKIKFYKYQYQNSDFLSMMEVAALSAKCGSFHGDNYSSSCLDFGSGTTEELDAMWNNYKAYYLSYKQDLIKEAADNYTLHSCRGYNKCIGYDEFNPYSSKFNSDSLLFYWTSSSQPCSYETNRLYLHKEKRFIIGDRDLNATDEEVNFTYFNQSGKCPGESDFFNLLGEIISEGELTTTTDLWTYANYTPRLYEAITGSAPGGTYIEYETVSTISGSSSEKLKLDFRLKGTSTLYNCGLKLEFIDNPNGYVWADIVGFSRYKLVLKDAVGGVNNYNVIVIVNDPISGQDVEFEIRASVCSSVVSCEFYDQFLTTDYAKSMQILMSALAYNGDLTNTSAVDLESNYSEFLTRHIRNVVGGITYTDLEWIYNGSGSFTLSDPTTMPTGTSINLSVTSYDPGTFAHADLNKIKYFENIRISPLDIEHGFIVDAWYEPTAMAPLEKVTITFNADAGIMVRAFDPVPLDCDIPEFRAQRDLELLLSDVLLPKPTDHIDLSSNVNYTDLLESFLGKGHAYMLEPEYTNDEIKGYIQILDAALPGGEVINQCSFGLFRLEDAYASLNDFNDIIGFANLKADELKIVDGKTYYFTVEAMFPSGIVETIGGYTSCIPLKSCGCYATYVSTCHNDFAAVIDLTSQYNANYSGNNPNSFELEPITDFSLFHCQCGKEYLAYLSSYTNTAERPMTLREFVKNGCAPKGILCPGYSGYIESVERYNDLNPLATIEYDLNPNSEDCDCLEGYIDYLATFNSSTPLFSGPPMSLSEYQDEGCEFPGDVMDNCSTLLSTYTTAVNTKITDFNSTVIPPSSSLPGASLPPAVPGSSDCNCIIRYIALLDKYIMNGLANPSLIGSFTPAPDFATFVGNGCQGPCISEYFLYVDAMENLGITPDAYDEAKCPCYLLYVNYVLENTVDGIFTGLSLEDYSTSYCGGSSFMMAGFGGGGEGSGSEESEGGSELESLEADSLSGGMEMFSLISLEEYTYEPKPRNPCVSPDTANYPKIDLINGCFDYLDDIAEMIARTRYQQQIEYFTARFRDRYLNTCMSPTEEFTLEMPNYDYHYTLYYYDQGGNLVRTVPPAGVQLITNSTDLAQIVSDRTNDERQVFTEHGLVTTYEYNSLNQLMRQSIPDNNLMNRWTVYDNSTGIPSGTTVTELRFVDANVGYLIGNSSLGTELYRTTDAGRTFNPVSIQTADLKRIKMLDASNGFAVGAGGLLFQTTDGGSYWKVIQIFDGSTPVTGTINDFYFKSTTEGILVGENGLCYHAAYSGGWTFTATSGLGSMNLKSVDFESSGGTTLGFVAIDNAGVAEIRSITSWPGSSAAFTLSNITIETKLRGTDIHKSYFIDNSTGFAAGVDGQLFKTTDGGSNWTHISTNCVLEFKDLYFVDASNGMALAADGKFYSTSTGGTTWTAISALGEYKSLHIYDKASATKSGYAVGDDGLFAQIYYQSGVGFRVFKEKFFSTVSTDFTAVFGLSSTELYVGGAGGYLAKVAKVGSDWTLTTFSAGISDDVKKLYFYSNALGAVLTDVGDLSRLDYSGSWSSTPISATDAILDFDYGSSNLTALEVSTSGASAILHVSSVSSLSSWSTYTVSITTMGDVSNISVVNTSSNYVLTGDNGSIYKGTTSSVTDNSLNTRPLVLTTIRAINGSNTIFASGNDGTMIQSTDDGATWQTLATGTYSDLYDLDAVSTTEAYAVGETGVMVKYTTSSSLLSTGTTQDLHSVKKYNSTYLAAGGKNKTLVFSSNSGTNFGSIFLPRQFASNSSINTLHAQGSTLYLTGGNGVIFKYNAGTISLTYNVPEANNSIRFDAKSQMGLVTCDNSTVITSEDMGQTWKLQPMLGGSIGTDIHAGWIFSKTNVLLAGESTWCRKWNYSSNSLTTPSGLSTSGTLKDVAFNELGRGIVLCGTNGVYYSYDYGATFTYSTIASAILNGVDIDGPEAYIAGNSNKVYHYSGLTNSSLGSPNTYTSSTTSTNFNRITLLDRTIGYLVGDNGQMIKMMNPTLSAAQFYQEYSEVGHTNTSDHLYAVDFNKRGTLVMAGASGYVRTAEDDARTVSNIFWYDELGRLIVSQNSKQFGYATPAYSYTQFDALGRIVEVGEAESSSGPEDYMLVNNLQYSGVVTWIGGSTRRQVTSTYYDEDFAPMGAGITQINLRKRVASITYEETYDGNDATYDHATHYTYDIHGNVDVMVQEVPALATYGSEFKKIRYEYDLVSGKVNSVHFNEGELDQFHHRYTYDADNRIIEVETSRDNINWDIDARYQYYAHGPLMRAEIGDLMVQGIDFAYTLHGWIKGVNAGILDPDRDMGRDGKVSVGNLNQYVARDAFGYILGYYSDPGNSVEDYIAINSSGTNHFAPATSGSDLMTLREDLYNGNITTMQTVLPNCSTYNASRTISSETFGNAYKYDQLNRIKQSRVMTNLNTSTNTWGSSGPVTTDYSTDYDYDANGNITNLTRWGNGSAMDQFVYNYDVQGGKLISNRLYHVNDMVGGVAYPDDIDDQGTFDPTPGTINTNNNYGYDELGNLVRDDAEEIASIEWNVQGKIVKVNRSMSSTKPELEFTYDAMGQRLSKKVTESGGNVKTYYYIRDAQGNEMCRYVAYTESGDDFFVSEEHSIYGSSRLGLQTRRDTLYQNTVITPDFEYVYRDLGTKQYELSNHLGNVLATVTDQHKPIATLSTIDSYEPVIVSISDYYPFGSAIADRSWSDASRAYRYGFNKSEKAEMMSMYMTEYRMYCSSIARWLSLDKITVPSVSSYTFTENNPINYSDPSGLAKEKPIKITYKTGRDRINVTLARIFNANFRVAFRKWKKEGLTDSRGVRQKELIFSYSKNYKNKLTDLNTSEMAEGTITHVKYNGIMGKSNRYKIIEVTYQKTYSYETSPDGDNNSVVKHASGTAILHNKIRGDVNEYDAHNEVSGFPQGGGADYSVDGSGKNSKTFAKGTFTDNQKVDVTGSYYDQSQVNRDAFGMDGLGNSGNNFVWTFEILVRSYSDPVILKVPTNIFGGLKWKKATEYSPSSLESVFKKKTRQAQ